MSKFVPRVITADMAAQGYNNEGRGRQMGFITDPMQHEATCPWRKTDKKETCACRIGLWQAPVTVKPKRKTKKLAAKRKKAS